MCFVVPIISICIVLVTTKGTKYTKGRRGVWGHEFCEIYFRVIGVFRGSINLWFDFFAYRFNDSTARGDGLENWLEHLLGRGAVTLELHMSLIVGDRGGQEG